MQHNGNELPDLICEFLFREVKRLGGCLSERSAQENHRLDMGIDHILCTRFIGFSNVRVGHIPHFLHQ